MQDLAEAECRIEQANKRISDLEDSIARRVARGEGVSRSRAAYVNISHSYADGLLGTLWKLQLSEVDSWVRARGAAATEDAKGGAK